MKDIKKSGGIQGRYKGQSFQPTPVVKGLVVNTKDDIYNIGRVQVRIYNLHGTHEDGIPDEELPWASPCTLFSTHDGGSYLIPEYGSTVWCLFEDGDYSKPIYIGGSYGIGITTDRKLGKSELNERIQPKSELELPKQIKNEDNYIVFKSPVGKVFAINDNDDSEDIYLRDQLGQVIALESPMNKSLKEEYAYKDKYIQDMREINFSDWDGLKNWCKIIIKSLSHSIVSILSNKVKSIITIKSKKDDSESSIEMLSGDQKYIKAWVNQTNNRVYIDDSKIELVVNESTKIIIVDGNITLQVQGATYSFSGSSFNSSEDIFGSKSIIDTSGNTNHHSH